VTTGRAAFDLRTLEPGRTVEVNTPNAAFTIEHPGSYRVDVIGERTSFITRRAGRATIIPAGGESATMSGTSARTSAVMSAVCYSPLQVRHVRHG
jgi:hypothetical protein